MTSIKLNGVISMHLIFACSFNLLIIPIPSYSEKVEILSTFTRSGDIDMKEILKELPPNVDKTNAPDHIYHGVISAYGKVVDFVATQGVLIEKKDTYFKEHHPHLEGTFNTHKTEKEFLSHINELKKKQYTQKTYNLIENNCLNFVLDVVTFLGGEEPKKFKDQRLFAINNRENVKLIKAFAKTANVTLPGS